MKIHESSDPKEVKVRIENFIGRLSAIFRLAKQRKMPALKPPLEHRKAILTLSQISDDAFQRLIVALAADASIDADEVATSLADEIDQKDAHHMVMSLLSMSSVRTHYNMSVSDFVKSVVEGLSLAGDPTFSAAELDVASSRLDEILKSEGPVGFRSKIRELMTSHGMTLAGCRIITDIRPVFGDDVEGEPREVFLVHTIKLEYIENGDRKEIFLATDPDGLKSLKIAVERTETKQKTLSSYLQAKGVTLSDQE